MRRRMILLAVISALLVLPALASAQQAQAEITGVVKDASGGVLPGVTVEASSPVLTEKVRAGVTDGSGQYRIVSLPPGTYTVTFTLTGFNTFRREGIELAGTFIAAINADLRVGALQETVTVTGESPVVDVQSARRQSVISGDVLQAIPTSRSYNNVLQLVPGVDPGTAQIQLAPTMLLFTAHGGNARDGRLTVDGINTGASRGGSGVSGYVPDMQNTQEVAFSISGNLGEAETGGPQMSVMPKSGGNRYSGSFFYTRIGQGMQDSNFTDRLKAAGLTAPPKILHLFDGQASIGGPIKRDRLWFFYNMRSVGRGDAQPGIFANKNAGDPNKWTYEPDLATQGRVDTARFINALRLTWQATPRNKLSVFYDNQPVCAGAGWLDGGDACRNEVPGTGGFVHGGSQVNGFFGPGPNAPETGDYQNNPQRVQQAKWQSPATNKLLLEAGFGVYASRWGYDERPGNTTRDLVRVLEQGTIAGTGLSGLKYRSSNWPHGFIGAHTWNASASYVTGAHNMKFGYQGAFHRDVDNLFTIINNTQRLQYRFLNSVPNLITQDAGPWTRRVQTEYAAFFVQDSWTRNRMTLQGALRFDNAWSAYPAQQIGPDKFVPTAITFPETKGVLGYKDISPRLGMAYDLFGDGKTSLKLNVGKYLSPATNQEPYTSMNPVERMVTQTTRSWNDRGGLGVDGDYVPQCNLTNPALNGECGPWLDQSFLQSRPTTSLAPYLLEGWGVRARDWQFGVSVQREIAPRVSVEVGYYRRWWQNFIDTDRIVDNALTAATDYQSYSITAPRDPRLPNGGGYTIGPLFDINPASGFVGRFDNVIHVVENFGDYKRTSDFIDINVSARLRNGLTLQGGTSTGRVTSDICAARAKVPESSLANPYCATRQPMRTTVKAIGTYIIPKADVQVSGTFSSLPGVSLLANVVVPTAVVAQSLGRPLSSNQPSVTVNMLQPQTVFGDRANDLDLRIAKIFRAAGTRTNLALDIVNTFNSDAVLGYNPTLGTISTAGVFTANATWPTPTAVLQARLVRVSIQFDW